MLSASLNESDSKSANASDGASSADKRKSTPATHTLEAPERVLSTLNRDGSRRWLRPIVSRGSFLTARRIVAVLLILLFVLLPFVKINERPAILLNVLRREFTFFGFTFLPTDTLPFAIFLISAVLAVFLVTALWGRVWCGWACPQTVYMEFLYRPIERFFDGPPNRQGNATRTAAWRTLAKYATYLGVSFVLANVFLAYFVGVDTLAQWVQRSPLEHPTSFVTMAIVTALMLFNFAHFREQTCIVACPYGRLQSVLLDRQSLIISYDPGRGEPRGKRRAATERRVTDGLELPQLAPRGDCVDCGLCVVTCPTGIDIRDGLQLECIGCAQCIDACDAVMDRIRRPRGLIRYSSQSAIAGERKPRWRPRLVLYPVILGILLSILALLLWNRQAADVTVLRGMGAPFAALPDGRVSNALRIKIANRLEVPVDFHIELLEPAGGELSIAENPLRVDPLKSRTDGVIVVAPQSAFKNGRCNARLLISDASAFRQEVAYTLLGPDKIAPITATQGAAP